MGAGQVQVFTSVTPERFAAMCAKVKANGIAIEGYSGTASKMGVEVGWIYSPAMLELRIQVLKDSFFMRAPAIDAKIAAAVKDAMAETGSAQCS